MAAAATRARSPLSASSAMRACCAHRFGSPELAGRSVSIVGVGRVGSELARRLGASGARLFLADIDERKRALAELAEAQVARPERRPAGVDIVAAVALGGVVSESNVELLRCGIVCGSANNQLAHEGLAEDLERRGILYAPDFVANAGGLINVAAGARRPRAGDAARARHRAADGGALRGGRGDRDHAARRRLPAGARSPPRRRRLRWRRSRPGTSARGRGGARARAAAATDAGGASRSRPQPRGGRAPGDAAQQAERDRQHGAVGGHRQGRGGAVLRLPLGGSACRARTCARRTAPRAPRPPGSPGHAAGRAARPGASCGGAGAIAPSTRRPPVSAAWSGKCLDRCARGGRARTRRPARR